ncbi:LysR family transcriptional regulator [Paenibacillus septentrionalis]|uniref:LysR family transcriptional regulator n=1 Tax=Paenibacillus septentrionalis TaxID=429342 RepID=A0ABW1V2L3_9BACL
MDMRQLKYFLTIAREGQITRAAKLLNMEQPPLSRQLKQMEDELGVKLFDRHGKGLKLTDAGMHLKHRAESLYSQFNETIEEMKELEQGVRGVLSIGAVFSCSSLLPLPIEQYRKKYPQVSYKILEGDHYYLGEQLEKHAIDLVFARLPFEALMDPKHLVIMPLPSDPFVVIVPTSWKQFELKSSFQLEELADYPLLTLKTDQTTHMHEQLIEACHRYGVKPNIVCECSSVAITIALIADGLGIALLPRSVMSSFMDPRVKMIPLSHDALQSDIGIVWLKDHYVPKRAQFFIETVKDVYAIER